MSRTGSSKRAWGRRRPRGWTAAVGATAVLLIGQGAGVYQLAVRSHAAPSFRRGGAFVSAGDAAHPYPYSVAGGAATGASSTTGPTTTVAVPAQPTTGISVPPRHGGAGPSTTAPHTPTTPAPPTSGAPGAPAELPAPGTYTYAVTGSEGASFFGNRDFPAQATLAVHTDPAVPAGQIVADLTLSSQHEEREILAATPDGLAFAFEGGSVTFGPRTQTSEADYDPPMLQIPATLAAGVSVAGTSNAVSSDGSTSRVEDWTITVVGQEVVDIGGIGVQTWVVDLHRQTRPGSADQLTRDRRYWYDPARALWVKWHETFHGERKAAGFTFTYHSDYTATLAGVAAG